MEKHSQNQIVPTNEVMGAMLSADIGTQTEKLKTDASGYIAENYGLDLSAFEISVTENSASQVHLPLPYYSDLQNVNAEAMADADVDEVAGGDLITAIVLAIIGISASVGVAAGVAGAGYGIAKQQQAAERNGEK